MCVVWHGNTGESLQLMELDALVVLKPVAQLAQLEKIASCQVLVFLGKL